CRIILPLFFLKDPPTPEIYTLSLHDALPISLIEAVAAYLDAEGRLESRVLPREAGFLYATESMRLTTRLMQLASWLLLQRAVNEDRKSTRLNSSHVKISYAVFCLKKKKKQDK